MARRSVLFSPGDSPGKMEKALNSDSDVVVLDLEDGVSPEEKESARENVTDILKGKKYSPEVWVRINPLDFEGRKDLDLLKRTNGVEGVVYPKANSHEVIQRLSYEINGRGMDSGIIPIIETSMGVLNAGGIAGASNVTAVIFGAEDLAADIGARRTEGGEEVIYAREKVVVSASAFRVTAIDTLYTNFENREGLRRDVETAIEMGYDGKLAIHPSQVEVINNAFKPESDEIKWARKVIEKKENLEGVGVFEVEGEMIDAPLIKQAERILRRADE